MAGLILFSIASCGGSSDRQAVETASEEVEQYAQADYSYEYDDELYDTYEEKAPSVTTFKAFPIYSDGRSPDNHYIPSGYMGDYSDITIDQASFDNPHGGTTAIKVVYKTDMSQGARWAGVYWQNPANNWGDRQGGYDLTGATKLTFWARGEEGTEIIREFKMGGISGAYPDTDTASIGPIVLTKEWKQYTIDLEGMDLSYIIGGFCWVASSLDNPQGAVFYLDDIIYE